MDQGSVRTVAEDKSAEANLKRLLLHLCQLWKVYQSSHTGAYTLELAEGLLQIEVSGEEILE